MLETHQWSDNAFVTLTYSDENLPMSATKKPSLYPKHVQDWLKRLRKEIEPIKVRYYAVGEYGDESHRPHYHAAMFNLPTCSRGNTRAGTRRAPSGWQGCCPACELVGKTWGHGNVYLGVLEAHSAQYICGYVTKKMTKPDDARLEGRYPEFARMSLRPAIGLSAMHDVASEFMRFNLDSSQADVPSGLRHGKKVWPLGRYLTGRLREMTGKEKQAPEATIQKIQEAVQPVRQAAFDASQSFSEALAEANKGSVASVKARAKIQRQRKTL